MVNLTNWNKKRAYQRNIGAPFRQFCSLKHGGMSDLNGDFIIIIITLYRNVNTFSQIFMKN